MALMHYVLLAIIHAYHVLVAVAHNVILVRSIEIISIIHVYVSMVYTSYHSYAMHVIQCVRLVSVLLHIVQVAQHQEHYIITHVSAQ